MNSRRMANRAASRRSAGGSHVSEATGNRARGSSSDGEVMDHGSPRSYMAQGGGPVMGAGEMPAVGPGTASKRYSTIDNSNNPMSKEGSRATPKGMSIYREE